MSREFVVLAVDVVGQADVFRLAPGLQFARIGQLGLPVAQVVHGQQFHLVGAQALERLRELRLAGGSIVRCELGRQPDPVAHAEFGHQVAEYVLGIAVVGRGVDDGGTAGDETPQNFLQRPAARRIHLETARGAHPDHWDGFAGGGDRTFRQAGCGGGWRSRQAGQWMQRGGRGSERSGREKGAAIDHGGTSWHGRGQRWWVSLMQNFAGG